jgi:nucleotide-binding universal stress UspA family protein
MARCMVCGIDEPTGGRHAASVAARLARDLGSRAVLVHVAEPGGLLGPLRLGRGRRWRRSLKAVSAEHCFPDGTELRVRSGAPDTTLMAIAGREDAELIVVGAGGESLPGVRLIGSVASTLMQRASCPVVVVPPRAVAPLDAEGMRSVVCGVAGEESDAPLLRLADDFAARLGGALHAVHAYEPASGRDGSSDPVRDAALREAADNRLALALKDPGIRAEGSVLPMPAAEALEWTAEQERAALIVVAAKARPEPRATVVLGSVPAELAAQGRTAVVVLPLGARLEPGTGHYELVIAPA